MAYICQVNEQQHAMSTIHVNHKLYKNPADAVAAAANAAAADVCGWKYVAVHCPYGTGYSFINIFDEDGEFVGKLF